MTSRSAAVYGLGGVLLVACLAAANMPQADDQLAARTARPPRPPGPDTLALEVNAQADRLRTLMAQAPTPAMHARNPFSYRAAPAPRVESSPTVRAAVVDDAPAVAPPPALTLMGVAEDTTPAGPRRTAIIGGDADALYMVGEGDTVGDRYRVTKIGADAVELEDLTTKGFRRLALR